MNLSEWISAALILAGMFFFVAGTVGLLRFPDFFTRLHALTKADNLGFGLVIAVPSMIFFRHFRGKVESLVFEMEQQASKLVDVVHGERFDFVQPTGQDGEGKGRQAQ